jgi:predicted RND superfamily exporter protein
MIERAFEALAAFSVRRPWLVLGAALAVTLAALWAIPHRLELRTSNLDLISPDLPEVRKFTTFAERFGTPNVLIVVLEGRDAASLHAAVDRSGPLLAKAPGVRAVVDRLPFDEATLEEVGVERYLMSDDHRLAFMLVQPSDARSGADTIAPFVDGARRALGDAHLETLGVHAGLTGMPAYALDDRDILQRDISMLSGIAGLLELLLLVAAFGSFWRPLLAVATLMVSLVLVLGLATIVPGHLTLLSSFFVSIAFGEGIDFAIHVFGRVEELTAGGMGELEAIPTAVRHLSRGMTTTVLTTSAVFLAMTLSGFRGFAELGVIAAMTLPTCLLASLTILPAAIAAARLRPPATRHAALRPLRRFLARRRHPVLAVAIGATAIAALLLGGPGFDRNYLDLEPRSSEAVRLERAMVERSSLSPNFAVFVTDSKSKAIDLSDRLLREDVVGDVASIADLDALAGEGGRADAAWRRSFESADGKYAVYAYPQGDAWEPATQALFIERMRALDPDVTGMPFLGSFMVDRSLRALAITAAIALLVVFACAWLDFRSLPLTLLVAVPTVLSLAALHGLMHALGLRYNPLNVMALPIVVGYAVDDAVHVVHRFLAEHGDVARTLEGAGSSIFMTSATTVVSFGTLAFTEHRGLASFAVALTLGVSLALLVSTLVLPPLLDRFAPIVLRRRRLELAA